MVVLRKKIADGTALPGELAEFEQTSRERQEALDKAMIAGAEALVRYRDEKLYISGLWNALYQVAKIVRDMGYSAKDFHPDNCIYVGGGLKRAQLPPDYQEFVHQTFNIPASRDFQNYSMQELNSGMPKCQRGGRYHVPPWIVPFILDEEGHDPAAARDRRGRRPRRLLRPVARRALGRDHHRRQDLPRFQSLRLRLQGPVGAQQHRPLRGPPGRRQDRLRRHRRRLRARPVMNAVNAGLEPADAPVPGNPVLGNLVSAPFFLRGELVEGQDAVHRSRDLGVAFATPRIDLDRVVHPRTRCRRCSTSRSRRSSTSLSRPASGSATPATPSCSECIDRMAATHVLPRAVLEEQTRSAAAYLDRRLLHTVVEQNFPDPKALDEWVPKQDFTGRRSFVRAFAPRLIHVLPGNSPGVAVKSIAQGAMVKAVNLFKMSSSDPFTTVAVLRTMADIDPDHAIVKSMSAVYWRGGDDAVERALYRPQYFDKIVAWGGGDAISNVIKYLGPGFQLVSFDPKTSISMVGREAVASRRGA